LFYNEARPHQGRWCFGKTPMQTFVDAMPMTKEKTGAAPDNFQFRGAYSHGSHAGTLCTDGNRLFQVMAASGDTSFETAT
jgi:hypothetical protein